MTGIFDRAQKFFENYLETPVGAICGEADIRIILEPPRGGEEFQMPRLMGFGLAEPPAGMTRLGIDLAIAAKARRVNKGSVLYLITAPPQTTRSTGLPPSS